MDDKYEGACGDGLWTGLEELLCLLEECGQIFFNLCYTHTHVIVLHLRCNTVNMITD